MRRSAALVARGGRVAVAVVFLASASNWLGWATGSERLTRIFASWPQMTPWAALLLAVLGVRDPGAVGVPVPRAGAGSAGAWRSAAAVVVLAILAEYATGRAFGLDQLWFPGEVTALQKILAGPSEPADGGGGSDRWRSGSG